MRKAAGLVGAKAGENLPESFGYSLKRRLLGPPMVTEQLREERLSRPIALGVLSPDAISSSAYGTEEILIELLKGGLAVTAFALVLPLTGVVLAVLLLVTLSYREVVMVYTRAGGSYVVARENFGPRIAQVAAVALLIDYIVTVAVQTAAGTVAVVSAVPRLGPYSLEITVAVVLILCYGNLRGIREAGRSFALPTYLFAGVMVIMIIVGLLRELLGTLPRVNPATLHGTYYHPGTGSSLVAFGTVFVLLRAFANGGSSLTGVEAISNGVSAFRPPEGPHARRVLVIMASILGFLVAGVSWLAHLTHATPYVSGYPSVISQEARLVFGSGSFGTVLFYVVQGFTALILYTGGNTSFNGFPFLASFVAGDAFLPRWLTKRGHRLVFSNGIIVLTVLAIALLVAVGSNVNNLVPFYAIGVFTGFAMAGFGMVRHHHRIREPGWRRKMAINGSAGILSAVVVVIFAVAKFTEGAWAVLVLFAVGVPALIALNRQYRVEAAVLDTIGGREPPAPPNYARRVVLVFVDEFDLATIAAVRYARGLRPTALRAVHFVLDQPRADALRERWFSARRAIPLDFVECPDRRVERAAAELVAQEASEPGTHVTVVLPRRGYSPLLGRFLHDRTADKIARVVSRIPGCAATIIPFDVQARLEMVSQRHPGHPPGPAAAAEALAEPAQHPPLAPGVTQMSALPSVGRATVEGRVHGVEIRPTDASGVLACAVTDGTGQVTALFYGRTHIPGVNPGSRIRLRGRVAMWEDEAVMINPAYELVE